MSAPGDTRTTSNGSHSGGPGDGPGREGPAGIATALAEISERATLLIHEEVELAKAEVTESVTKLARGAAVSIVAGVFIVTAIFFALIGGAWLIYFYLPVNTYAYFWGFFAMAVILLLLGALAGLIAARVFRRSRPPVPAMAIEEARKIAGTVSAHDDVPRSPAGAPAPFASTPPPGPPPAGSFRAPVGGPQPPVPPAAGPSAPPVEPAPPAVASPAAEPPVVEQPPPAAAVADEAASAPDQPQQPTEATTDELGPPVQEPPSPDDPNGAA